jgi:hypothetical protein
MLRPPGDGHSLKGIDQLGNGGNGEDRGFGTRLGRQAGAGHRHKTDLAGHDLDLTVANVAR